MWYAASRATHLLRYGTYIRDSAKTRLYIQDMGDDKNGTCSICLDAFNDVERLKGRLFVHRLPCGHTFHVDCIAQWIEQVPKCPECNANIDTSHIERWLNERTRSPVRRSRSPARRSRLPSSPSDYPPRSPDESPTWLPSPQPSPPRQSRSPPPADDDSSEDEAFWRSLNDLVRS